MASFAPALGLLLIMGVLAWVLHWLKKRHSPAGTGQGAELRLVSQLPLGPQQRIVVVEVNGPKGPVQLTLGVTPQHVRTLHTQVLDAKALSPTTAGAPDLSYQAVAQALAASEAAQGARS